ncbi:hypothetical protein Tco_1033458, partial [Tanacetum coccineum]
MQQFWYSIKKLQGKYSYKFLLANKKCIVNVEVFRIILDICPRVEGVDFTDVPDDDTALTFLIDLGYKGPLYKHTNMFMDHMHRPWRTLATIINKCLSRKTASNDKLRKSKIDILWGCSKEKMLTILCEDYQEYRLPIPETMLTKAIKQSESYQMFIKYSTSQICPKKSRGKESEPEPELARKKTSSKRRVKKKVTLSADDNIIFDDLDVALELAKSISKTEAEEVEAARKVYATHARIVTESVPESAKKKSGGRTLKESKKTSRRQSGTGGSNEGTGSKSGVPDESTVISSTSSKGTGIKPRVPNEEKDITKEKVILEWGDEQDSEYSDDVEKDDKDGDADADDEGDDHISDTQDADDEDVETESDEDDIYKYKIRVRKDEDEEMNNAEVYDYVKGDEEVTSAAKADAEKTLKVKDDPKKTKLPPSSSSLFVSLGFGDQLLKLSSDSSLVSTVKDTTDSEINSLLEVKIQSKVPYTQSPSMLTTATTLPPPFVSTTPSVPQQTKKPIPIPTIITDAPTVTTAVLESEALSVVQLRVANLEKDVSDLKKIDLFAESLAALKTQVPSVVDNYLGSKDRDLHKKLTPTVDLEQGSENSASEILKIKREQAEKQQTPKFTIKSTDKAALEEYDLKSALYQSMHANKSFNRNPANHQLYYALMKALIKDENTMDKGFADTIKDYKRKHDDDDDDDDDEDPPVGPNQGKKTKRRRTKEYESSKKPSSTKETPKGKAPTKGSKTALDDNQPQDTSEPKTRKTPNPYWFKQPPRPPTPDPEWNKRQVVLDQPEQPWFNQLASTIKDPLTFNSLMATPIDFSKYVLNGLKIENLTQDILLGPAFNLLKYTCSSSIELECNFQECFNALTDKLDWNNPEGDRYPFDLSKPFPLQGTPGYQTVAADYFFNNDLEYLKTSDPEVTYTTSITKTKAARYEIKGIEDMVLTLWSTIKHAYGMMLKRESSTGVKDVN